jgi:phosphoglycolate phosphatase
MMPRSPTRLVSNGRRAQLVVFDLDGTLIDSRRDLADATNALLIERGGAPLPVDEVARMVGDGAALLLRRALAAVGLDPASPDALPRFLELYDERLLHHTRPYDGIPAVLETLAAETPLAVLTNKPRAATERVLDGLGLRPFFRWVHGGDGPFPRKPDPAALLDLAAAAGADPAHTVLVGDSAVDLATARAAATQLCLARYGFGYRIADGDITPDDEIVDSPADIPRAVHRLLAPR